VGKIWPFRRYQSAGYNAEGWNGVALPLVRRVFGEIAAKEFVSVQPMNLPSGLVFYLDFKYGTNVRPFATNGSLYGANATTNVTDIASQSLYGAGKFGYSINQYSASIAAVTNSVSWSDVNLDQNYVVTGSYKKIQVPLPSNADLNGARAFVFTSGSINATDILQAFTSVSNNTASFIVTGSLVSNNPGQTVTLFYDVQPTADARGDFEDGVAKTNANTTISIPEINVQLKSEAIVAKTRKLKAQWTPEFAQDLNAYHSVDAEAELTGYYNTQGGWFQTLGTKLQKVSNTIHQLTLRGGANFLVTSPTIATILESIPGFASDGDGEKLEYNFGIQKVGSLNSRYKVYKNPYMTENVILMGYKGAQFLECGAVFAPYVPLIMTPLLYDPSTFTPRKGLMTRYAKKMIRPDYYGKIYVAGLNTL